MFGIKKKKPLPPPEPDKARPPVGPKTANIPFKGKPDATNS